MNLTRFYEDTQRVSNPEEFLSNLKNCKVLSTVSQDEDEAQWLANRSRGIGGSEIGTICGVNKYSSARLLYFKKTGQFEDSDSFSFSDEAKERMSWGHKLEPIVADEFMRRTGKKIVISPATLVHKDYDFAIANVDRFIVDDEGKPVGVLECKTADARLNKDWEDGEIPMSYIYQLQWYLWITGLEYGAFAALVGGNKFYYYEVYRNDNLLETEMIPAADSFWNYNVKQLVEPGFSGGDVDGDFLKEQYGDVVKNSEISLLVDDEGEPTDEYNELAEEFVALKQHAKEVDNKINAIKYQLQEKIKNNEIAYTADHIIKWSPRSSTIIDSAVLKSEFPEVYEAVIKKNSYRVFTIK